MSRQHVADPALEFIDLRRSARLCALNRLPAEQQPCWEGHPDLACIRAELADLPALIEVSGIGSLRRSLAKIEAGAAYLLHVGECAELFSMATTWHVARRLSLYRRLAGRLADRTGRQVILVTRMAGQHAKPRSQLFETLRCGDEIPVYRGDAVNCIEPAAAGRKADPWRMLTSYDRSRDTLEYLRGMPDDGQPVFVSHEALLKDYEEPMTRGGDVLYSASGHLVWVGERTRGCGDWHVQWASSIANPVAVKIGPTATSHDVIGLVRALNPRREPGRLSLIARMGAAEAAARLAALAGAVAENGSPVIWQCDPMHGNTRKLGGMKLRLLPEIRAEITAFVRALRTAGCHPGGLHLEVTPEDLTECHEDVPTAAAGAAAPPCDPRLNHDQAMDIVDHFANEITGALK